jgi:hypothetical protein
LIENNREQIIEMRLHGVGYKKIASTIGISRDKIKNFCKQAHISGDPELVKQNYNVAKDLNCICSMCGVPIKQKCKGVVRKFCSDSCRYRWWQFNAEKKNRRDTAFYNFTCTYCKKEFTVYGNNKRKYCSHDCYVKDRFGGTFDGV